MLSESPWHALSNICNDIHAHACELAEPSADGTSSQSPGLAHASIRHRLTVVPLFYDHLVEVGVRVTNPVARGRRGAVDGGWCAGERGLIRMHHKLPSIPDETEWHALLAAACSEPVRNRLMLAFAYDCALRREELCGLATGDIDPARRLLRVRAETTKTKRARVVPYSVVSAYLYMAYLAERRRLGN